MSTGTAGSGHAGVIGAPVAPVVHAAPADERAERLGRLAVAYRLFARFGYDHWVAGHITVRDPEHADRFWVNPFGRSWAHLRASDLLCVDVDGVIVSGDGTLNAVGFWGAVPLFLLPLSLTMAMLWKTKEVILDSIFAARG